MKLHRFGIFIDKNRSSTALSKVLSYNFQPRIPSLGKKLYLGVIALLACAAVPDLASAGILTVTPSTTSFGTVALGTKNSQTLQLRNSGSTGLTISSATLMGVGFSMSDLHIPRTLASGETTTLTVSFAPVVTGSATATVVLKSNASNPTVSVSFSGTGGAAARTLSMSTSSLSFGNEPVGGSSALGVTVKNTGNSSVTISQVTVSGAGFGIGGGFIGATLAAGQSATLTVMFSPQSTGSVTGKITVSSTASNGPHYLTTTGTGVTSVGHSIALGWSASTSTGVVGYYVYRSTVSGASYSRLNALPTAATKFTDASVAGGATYYYVVTAVNALGVESPRSGQIAAAVP